MTTAHNGSIARIVDLVRQRPGLSRVEIVTTLGMPRQDGGLLSYALRAGHIHSAGLKRSHRYYATADLAAAAHAALVAATLAERTLRKRQAQARRAMTRRAQRHATGKRPVNKRSTVMSPIGKGTVLAPDVKVTVAPPLRDRFAPGPGFVAVITADWMARRGLAKPDREVPMQEAA